jgi:hypothetical protein
MSEASASASAIDYGETDGDEGFDITDPVDIGDLSDQEGNDVIEKASKVRFEIRKASVRDYVKQGEVAWRKKFLALDLVVGPLGVDGEGKYANKHFFQDLLLVANTTDYPDLNTDHYKTKARFQTKMFLKAMGFDPAAPPRINDEFLEGLLNQEVVADIQRKEIQTPPAEPGGKWVGTGDYSNIVANFRAAS